MVENYDVQKWQITFTLGLNAGENTDYMEKATSKRCLELNSYKNVGGPICRPPPPPHTQSGARWLEIV